MSFFTRYLKFKYRNILGSTNILNGSIKIYHKNHLLIGRYNTFNNYIVINAKGGVIIGNYCVFSDISRIYSTALNYREWPSVFNSVNDHVDSQVNIGDNVWIASGVVILPGSKIGNNVVVAANSVVSGELEAGYLYAGSPAIKVKKLKDV